jgi:hypothetical protein
VPSAAELVEHLGDDVVDLLASVDRPIVEVAPLRGVGYPGYCPSAFRLRFAGDLTLTVRRLGSLNRAGAVEYVSRHLNHAGFPKVLARAGKILLIEWIDGQPLHLADCGPALIRECAALQGLMHTLPVPSDCPYRPVETIYDWHSRLQAELGALVEATALEETEAQRAFDVAMKYAPSSYTTGFVHRDFCPENIVWRPSGRVCAIDTEALAIDAQDYDLGRTWYRWPMSPAERENYLQAYDSHRSSKDFLAHFPYWAFAALTGAAVFRLQKRADTRSLPISRLRALLRDLEEGRSAAHTLFHS